jgi:hypothetical protein
MKLFIISTACVLFAFLQLASAQNLRPNEEHRELLTCEAEEKVECGLFKNETGVLACREFGGSWWWWSKPSKHTLCLPEEFTDNDDDCGCCEEPCPAACSYECDDEDVDGGDGSAQGVYLNYTRTGKLRCVSKPDSVTLQLFGVYDCAVKPVEPV